MGAIKQGEIRRIENDKTQNPLTLDRQE